MSKTILNAIRFIAAALFGAAIVYIWSSQYGERELIFGNVLIMAGDPMLLAGIGITATLVSYFLLYMFGKGGGN